MSSTGLAAFLAFAAGLGGAVQIAVQGRLGDRVGSIEALATASLIGALVALAVLLAARRSLAGIGDALGSPKWMLLGGVMSALIILASRKPGSATICLHSTTRAEGRPAPSMGCPVSW